jgi:hypothetical protein
MDVHRNEKARVELEMLDADGNTTTNYQAGSIKWTLSHPDSMALADEDANPLDAVLTFTELTPPGEDASISVSFDGDPGTGVRTVRSQSQEPIRVVEGEAVAGVVHVIKMDPV